MVYTILFKWQKTASICPFLIKEQRFYTLLITYHHVLVSANPVSRPAANPLSRVRAPGPVYQRPAPVADQPHGVALHLEAVAKQGGATGGSPDPAAEKNIVYYHTIISVGNKHCLKNSCMSSLCGRNKQTD